MPLVSNLLHTTPLIIDDWIIILITCIPVVLGEEIRKLVYFNNTESN